MSLSKPPFRSILQFREGGWKVVRKIIHIDMDAFYASVEIRDNPSLRGKPVIVGGMPGTRGVVCTASYEARKFGVHSAMSADLAARLCPQGIFLRPRGDAYRKASAVMHSVFHEYTDVVEPLSLDEAYLDVTDNKPGLPYASTIAREIKRKIYRQTGGLTASAGVSYNKFLAKIASDLEKPDGLTVIRPEDAVLLLEKLPIEKFHGVGRATAELMHKLGIRNGADLRKKSKIELAVNFGVIGEFYYNIVRGIDEREVCADRERKSLGTEETFEEDILDPGLIAEVVRMKSAEVGADMRARKLFAKTVTLKIKFHDFRSVTRSKTLNGYFDDDRTIINTALELLQKTDAGKVKLRLIGVTVSAFYGEKNSGVMVQPEFEFMKELPVIPLNREW